MTEIEKREFAKKAWDWFDNNIGRIATPSPYGTVIMLDRFKVYKEKFMQEMGVEMRPEDKDEVEPEDINIKMTWKDL